MTGLLDRFHLTKHNEVVATVISAGRRTLQHLRYKRLPDRTQRHTGQVERLHEQARIGEYRSGSRADEPMVIYEDTRYGGVYTITSKTKTHIRFTGHCPHGQPVTGGVLKDVFYQTFKRVGE